MWMNFTNLCGGFVDDILLGNAPREVCQIVCEPEGFILHQTDFNKKTGWMIRIDTKSGHDPKLHFDDEAKAKACYAFLASFVPRFNEDILIEIDALAQGAL